jgi:hypothetical protein
MKFLCLSAAAITFALGSCERHSWEDVTDEDGNVTEKGTKRLYKEHAEGHDQDGDGHSDHADGAHGDAKDGDKAHEGDKDKDGDKAHDDAAEEGAGHDHDGDGKPDH